MIPYGDLWYFLFLMGPIIPAVLAGLFGRRLSAYNLALAFVMPVFLFFTQPAQLLAITLFAVWEWGIVRGYLRLRRNNSRDLMYRIALVCALLPLVLLKLALGEFFWFLGLSYVTFRCLQLVVEIKDGLIKELVWRDFFVFVFFFPTLSSGPIDRYRRFMKDYRRDLNSREYRQMVLAGVERIFRGLLYKFILAVLIKTYWMDHATGVNFLSTLSYMYAYSFYLFFDFAGYSDFAIGVGMLLGIRTPENFRAPFLSSNIRDFWNRWHISLSMWFRDYVYMRLVMLMTKKKLLKNRLALSGLGYLALFSLMGIWHGLQLNYLLYGLYHAFLMTGFDYLEMLNKKRVFWGAGKAWDALAVFATFHLVCFGFLIFSGRII